MTGPTVRLDVVDGLARVTLDRPDTANAIDLELARDLLGVTEELKGRADVRAVLLAGAGERFCAGGDVRAFRSVPDLPAHLRRITESLHPAVANLVALDAPVVAAVQGSAAGAGLGLVLACDLVVAGRSARFVMAYTAIGLTPDGSSSWFLPRVVGARRALELALTNRVLDAEEAERWGIVTRVVADGDVLDRAATLASQLAAGPTTAFAGAKRLLRDTWGRALDAQLDAEVEELAAAGATGDAREGLDAFVEKRAPRFDGT